MIYTGMLAAVAGVLMSLEFSVPLMPPFYKVDFSDVPSVVAIFTMGPVAGACVEVIKLLIKLFTVGTNSMYVGEFANLIGIVMYVWPLWFIYKKLGGTKKAAVQALVCSTVIRTGLSCIINAFIIMATIPFNLLKVGLNYVVGRLLYVRLLEARVVPKMV